MGKISVVALIFLLALPGKTFAESELRKKILHADFEINSPELEQQKIALDKTTSDSITIDCTIARQGNCSLKSIIKNSERYIAYGALRSESNASKVPGVMYKNGDHFVYFFSLFMDDFWNQPDQNTLDIIWQFKRFGSGPDMFIGIKNNSLVWRITEHEQITLLKPLVTGKWIDVYFDIKWSEYDDGHANTRIEVEGQYPKDFNFIGRNMRFADSKYGTVQWGLYKPGNLEDFHFDTHFIHHDEIYIYKIEK